MGFGNQTPVLYRDGDMILERIGLASFRKFQILQEFESGFMVIHITSDEYDPRHKTRPIKFVSKNAVSDK